MEHGNDFGNFFGQQLQLSADGTELIVGVGKGVWKKNFSFMADKVGEVKMYQNLNGSWVEIEAHLVDKSSNDNYGSSVSISADGSVIALGASLYDGSGIDSGHVQVL